MKIQRVSQMATLALMSSIALAACGSASNTDAAATSGTAGSTGAAAACAPGDLKAEGSTAQANAMTAAAAAYQTACNAKLSYNGTGSGAGITSFLNKQVDFAGSDSALNPQGKDGDEMAKAAASCASPALNLPMITGPVAVAFKLDGVDALNLTSATIAKIFSGKITKWNDAAIAADNPGVTLPDVAITVFFRSDSSGTTDNFTDFLNTAAPTDWPEPHAKEWTGTVGQGKAKSSGVGQAVSTTNGGVSYVEWSYAIQNKLTVAKVNGVELTDEAAGKAVEAAQITGTGNDLTLKIDYATKAEGAYPIVLVTYEIVCSKYADPAKGAAVKSFMNFMTSESYQGSLAQIGSAPLPASILDKVKASVATIS